MDSHDTELNRSDPIDLTLYLLREEAHKRTPEELALVSRMYVYLLSLKAAKKRPDILSSENNARMLAEHRIIRKARIAGYVDCLINHFEKTAKDAKSLIAGATGIKVPQVQDFYEVGDLDSATQAASKKRKSLEQLGYDLIHRAAFESARQGKNPVTKMKWFTAEDLTAFVKEHEAPRWRRLGVST